MTSIRKNATKTTIAEILAVRAALENFYHADIVPSRKIEGADPVEMFNAAIRHAARNAEQAQLDAHRSAYFTLSPSGAPSQSIKHLNMRSTR